MLPENRAFWVRGDDGHEYGPVDLEELREWVRENRAGLGTVVRSDEPGAPWQPWQHYPELVALLAEVQVTSPVPGQPGLVIAPVWRRLVAWMMDIMLLSILLDHVIPMNDIMQATTNPATLQSLPTPVLYQIAAFVIIENACVVLYFTIWHAGFGRTPAKALLQIRVVDPNGRKPTVTKAFLRALALIFSMNLLFPFIYTFLNPQRRTLHDLAADTCVVVA